MAKKYYGSEGNYVGMEARLDQEREDGMMLREDPYAIANMPQDVKIKMYPKDGRGLPEDLDDTIVGVDRTISMNKDKMRRYMKPTKVS